MIDGSSWCNNSSATPSSSLTIRQDKTICVQSRIANRRRTVFGRVRRLAEDVLAHIAASVRLTVAARSDRQPPQGRCSFTQPRQSRISQIESVRGIAPSQLGTYVAGDCKRLRALRPCRTRTEEREREREMFHKNFTKQVVEIVLFRSCL